MNNNFDRLLKLAQKTKSTLVVYDPEKGDHSVILSVEQFEELTSSKESCSEQKLVSEENKFESVPQNLVTEPTVKDDLLADAAVLEALNQQIADWRATQVPVQLEPEAVPESTPEPVSVVVPELEPLPEAKLAPAPVSVNKSSSWHRLGDVMATNLKPKMPEVRYEEIGELEAPLPVTQTEESNEFSEPEPLDDEPLFLEEPVS